MNGSYRQAKRASIITDSNRADFVKVPRSKVQEEKDHEFHGKEEHSGKGKVSFWNYYADEIFVQE